jgi:hypothetical protein
MSTAELVRVWKDPEYRSEVGGHIDHPAGEITLNQMDDLDNSKTYADTSGLSECSSPCLP